MDYRGKGKGNEGEMLSFPLSSSKYICITTLVMADVLVICQNKSYIFLTLEILINLTWTV